MINNVVLVGRLTKDVELRYTQSGIAVASFTLAVERRFKNQQGERETDFILCVMWRQSAENFAKYTRKGSLVGVEGSIQTRNYENQQGQRVYVTEMLANNFALLEPKQVTESRGYENNSGNFNPGQQAGGFNPQQQVDPFAQQNQQQASPFTVPQVQQVDMFGGTTSTPDITDDQLPF